MGLRREIKSGASGKSNSGTPAGRSFRTYPDSGSDGSGDSFIQIPVAVFLEQLSPLFLTQVHAIGKEQINHIVHVFQHAVSKSLLENMEFQGNQMFQRWKSRRRSPCILSSRRREHHVERRIIDEHQIHISSTRLGRELREVLVFVGNRISVGSQSTPPCLAIRPPDQVIQIHGISRIPMSNHRHAADD